VSEISAEFASPDPGGNRRGTASPPPAAWRFTQSRQQPETDW